MYVREKASFYIIAESVGWSQLLPKQYGVPKKNGRVTFRQWLAGSNTSSYFAVLGGGQVCHVLLNSGVLFKPGAPGLWAIFPAPCKTIFFFHFGGSNLVLFRGFSKLRDYSWQLSFDTGEQILYTSTFSFILALPHKVPLSRWSSHPTFGISQRNPGFWQVIHIPSLSHYSVIRKDAILLFATWMNLEHITLNKISQRKKSTTWSFIWKIWKLK